MSQNAIAYRVVNWLELSESELPMLRRTAAGKWVIPGWDDAGIDAEISAQESQEFQGVRELTKTEEARVGLIFSYLKEYEPQPTADNLEKVSHYLEAFHHFCELAAWEEAWEVLCIRCDTPTREQLHNQLGIWGYYRLQIELYNQLLGKLDSRSDLTCYNGLGIAYNFQCYYTRAIECHQQELKIATEIGNRAGISRALGNLGSVYDSQGENSRAIDYYQQDLEISTEIGDREGIGAAICNLAIIYIRQRDYTRSMNYYQEALAIFREIGYRVGIARALRGLGTIHDHQDDYTCAINYQKQALEISREIGDRSGEGRANGHLGNAYNSLGDYGQAIEFHKEQLKIATEIGDLDEEGRAYANLGNAYNSLGDYRLAIKFHEKHLEIAREIGDRGDEGAANGSLGNVHYSLGDYPRAIKFHQKRLEIAREIGDGRGEANAWFNLGRALARVDEKRKAIPAYENARKLYQAMGLDQYVEYCDNSIRDIGMKVVVEPQRFLELPTTPARRKGRKFSRKWQQLKADIGNSFSIFFRWVSRWLRSVFRR